MSADSQISVQKREHDGSQLFVVDGQFEPNVVRILYEILKNLSFFRDEIDNPETKYVRHWNHEFALDSFASHPVLRTLHNNVIAKTNELFPKSGAELYRVHCNNQSYGDFQNVHVDLVPGVTALYYANPEWKEEWQGETVFFDNSGEPYYAVAPKPGRVVIFSGSVRHRGGAPSRTCFEPRLSVAFKFGIPNKSGD